MILQNTWEKTEMICDEKSCDKKFKPSYRNGIIVSRKCPNCRLKSLHRELKPKGVGLASELTTVQNKPEKRKKTPRQKAMDRADEWFSRYVRIINRVCIDNGDVICRDIITGVLYPANKLDNGHCFSRDCKATRYELNNCRPQNRSSNRFSGEADHYKFIDNLTKEIGEEEFTRIEQLRRFPVSDSEAWYKSKSNHFKKLVNDEIKKYGINKWW